MTIRDLDLCIGSDGNLLCQRCARYAPHEMLPTLELNPTTERSYRKRNHPAGWVQVGYSEFWACPEHRTKDVLP